jgi:hypothetical protein
MISLPPPTHKENAHPDSPPMVRTRDQFMVNSRILGAYPFLPVIETFTEVIEWTTPVFRFESFHWFVDQQVDKLHYSGGMPVSM